MEESIELHDIQFMDGEVVNVGDADGNRVFNSMENCVLIVYDDAAQAQSQTVVKRSDVNNKPKKRRSNLTEFDDSQSTKRKNETAKRELTRIVKQVWPVLWYIFNLFIQ